MKNERKNQDKSEMIKSAMENEELFQFVKSITKEERQRIMDAREFETIKPNTPTWKIAVVCDAIRSQARTIKLKLKKRLWNIDDLTNNISRLQIQLKTGDISECIKNGMTMNTAELTNLIQHNEWLRDGEVAAVPSTLAELRAVVGHKDVAQKIVMSQEEFDSFVDEIDRKLKEKGYDIFGELNA